MKWQQTPDWIKCSLSHQRLHFICLLKWASLSKELRLGGANVTHQGPEALKVTSPGCDTPPME